MSNSMLAARTGRAAPAAGARLRNTFAFLLITLVALTAVAQAGTPSAKNPLDLNQATATELEALPGIGAVKAAAILAVREERGGFASLDELESVRGIGPSLAKRLRPLVKVGKRSPSQAGDGSRRTAKK